MRIVKEATGGVRWREGAKQYCAIVTLDIKNAFNSASWMKIRQAMLKFGVPGYLREILDDYLDNRILLYDTNEGVQRYAVGVLSIRLPEGVTIV